MKPATPLRAENGPELAVSCEQRCQWFQPCAERSSQRCRRFHIEAVSHPHWCHRFQARWSAGVVSRLWPHRREKIRPAGEKRPILGCFACAGRTISRVGADGGEQGESFRARMAWSRVRGQAAVLVGGGGAWPGFETTRRSAYQQLASLVWRAPEGPEGTAGLRGAAPNEVRTPSLAGGRGLRRPEHQRRHTATLPKVIREI